MERLARGLLKLLGWSVHFTDPGTRRFVLIVAPHTSNWDFPLGLLAGWQLTLDPKFMAKHTLFRWYSGWLFRALGGIPVYRAEAGDRIQQMANRFVEADHLVLTITPEGTRSRADHWKSGFYHIARTAEVPVVMAAFDYGRKTVTVGGAFHPTGDIEADFEQIRAYYEGVQGRYPEQQGRIAPR